MSRDAVLGLLRERRPLVALTGAGASAESGVRPFRAPGATGWLWGGLGAVGLVLAGLGVAWRKWPRIAYFFFTHCFRAAVDAAQPNACHVFLARANARIVTTNVDGLHERAGADPARVAAIHGTAQIDVCAVCGGDVPCGAPCGGPPRPAVLLFYDYMIPRAVADAGRSADALVCDCAGALVFVVGVSWAVPSLVPYLARLRAQGVRVVHVNPAAPPAEFRGADDIWVAEPAGAFFGWLLTVNAM